MASRSRVKFYVNPVGVYRLGKEQSFEIVVCGAGGAEGQNRTAYAGLFRAALYR